MARRASAGAWATGRGRRGERGAGRGSALRIRSRGRPRVRRASSWHGDPRGRGRLTATGRRGRVGDVDSWKGEGAFRFQAGAGDGGGCPACDDGPPRCGRAASSRPSSVRDRRERIARVVGRPRSRGALAIGGNGGRALRSTGAMAVDPVAPWPTATALQGDGSVTGGGGSERGRGRPVPPGRPVRCRYERRVIDRQRHAADRPRGEDAGTHRGHRR